MQLMQTEFSEKVWQACHQHIVLGRPAADRIDPGVAVHPFDGAVAQIAGLVDEIDGLVRQEAVGDIAIRQFRRGDDGRMYHQYGEGHTVIDSSGAISQLPFKASMTRGYASDLRNQGQWYMNEAERIENGTSATWSSSRGTFGSAVVASSEVSGSRSERG